VCREAMAYTRCGTYSVAHLHKMRSAKSAGKGGLGDDASSPINGAKEPQTPPESRRRWEKGAAMNKTELIERIAEEADVPKGEAQKHFEAFEQVVTEALKGGEEVRITGFGKFSVRERKAREGRNPQTGEKMKIAASKVPAFSAGNALKKSI
jgi:DNA-binding protein HU-beta